MRQNLLFPDLNSLNGMLLPEVHTTQQKRPDYGTLSDDFTDFQPYLNTSIIVWPAGIHQKLSISS